MAENDVAAVEPGYLADMGQIRQITHVRTAVSVDQQEGLCCGLDHSLKHCIEPVGMHVQHGVQEIQAAPVGDLPANILNFLSKNSAADECRLLGRPVHAPSLPASRTAATTALIVSSGVLHGMSALLVQKMERGSQAKVNMIFRVRT